MSDGDGGPDPSGGYGGESGVGYSGGQGWEGGFGLSEGLSDLFGFGPSLGGPDPGGYGNQGGPDFTSNQGRAVGGQQQIQPVDPNVGFWQQLVDAQRNTAMGSVDMMNLTQPGMLERLGFTSEGGMSELDQLLNQKYMSALKGQPDETDQLINQAFTSSLKGGLSSASQVSFDKMRDLGMQSTATRGGMGGTGEAQLMGELAKGRATMSQQDQTLYGGLQDMRAGRQQQGLQMFGGLQNMRTGQAMQGLQGLMNMRGGVMGQLGSGGAQEKYFAEKGWGMQKRQLDQNEPDMGQELLGTLLPMLGMGLIMSDIQLKHDIEYL